MKNELELQNNHNVYILGAGFSAQGDLPTISDFMHKMRDSIGWLKSQRRNEEYDAIISVLRFMKEASSATRRVPVDIENIEDLFSLAAASPRRTDGRSSKNDIESIIPLAIAATLDFALKTGSPRQTTVPINHFRQGKVPQGWNSTGSEYRPPLLDYEVGLMGGYFDNSDDQLNTIISFNYDTLVEDALLNLKIPFSYDLPKITIDPVSQNFNGNLIFEYEKDLPTLQVLKPHGSVNWVLSGYQKEKLRIYDSYQGVREEIKSPFLIPPTWKKTFPRFVGDVLNKAGLALRTATRIIILGYSLPDPFFKFLIAAGLQENISLREIYFVNNSLLNNDYSINHTIATGNPDVSQILEQRLLSIFRDDDHTRKMLHKIPRTIEDFLTNDRQAIRRNSP